MKVRNIFAAVALGLVATAVSAETAKMNAIQTVPHEFDMLLKSGHIQGLACSENGIYLSHQDGLTQAGVPFDARLEPYSHCRMLQRNPKTRPWLYENLRKYLKETGTK